MPDINTNPQAFYTIAIMKVLNIIGARPQIIKAAAIHRAIKNHYSQSLQEVIVHTGQHYDHNMSQIFMKELAIPEPDYNLGVGSAQHGEQTAKMIEKLEPVLIKENPEYIILYGDTNSTLAGAVAASKLHIAIVHVEAGLRSFNRKMPEEINRVVCDHLSTLLFVPSWQGYQNLVREGFSPHHSPPHNADHPGIYHCGDVMYDNSLYFSALAKTKSNILTKYNLQEDQYILATLHRDHNTDIPKNLSAIFKAFLLIAEKYKIILPLHPRTKRKLSSDLHKDLLNQIEKSPYLIITDPVSFLDMINLESHARMIITDSGGVQKESYFFNKPCMILRGETEWTEILETGKAVLVSADHKHIIQSFHEFMNSDRTDFPQIFGDGHAAEHICETMINNQ